MPYIQRKERLKFDASISSLSDSIANIGELNYCITSLVARYLYLKSFPQDYAAYSAAIGVLECAKLELYRRRVAGYEDTKRMENGDVY